MKTYGEFITERAGGPASPKGRAQAAKAGAQNQQNRNKKPGALVPVKTGPNTGGNQKENLGKRPTPQSRPQGVSGFKRPTTARTGQRANALERYREKSNKTGFKAGVKQALGGDLRSKDASTRRKAQHEFGKKLPGRVVSGANAVRKFISKGNVASGAGATGAEIAQGETITKGNA